MKSSGCSKVSSLVAVALMVLVGLIPIASASLPVPHVKPALQVVPVDFSTGILPDGSRAPMTYSKASSYDQLVNWYKALATQYPNYIKVWKANEDYGLGLIVNRSGGAGYPYYMVELTNFSKNVRKPEVLYVGSPHGDETVGPNGQYWFCSWILRNALTDQWNTSEDDWLNWILDNREMYFSVTHNPDGFNNQNDAWGYGRLDAAQHDLNREADWDFQPNLDEGYPQPATGATPWLEVNNQVLKAFVANHRVRIGADIHGGVREILYPWSSSFNTVSATSKKSGASYNYVPPDFNFYDVSSLRLGKYIGGYDGSFDQSNVGPVPPTVGYEAPGGIVSWAYGGDVINNTVDDPHVKDETYGNYNGSGILWVSPEMSTLKNPNGANFGGDNQAGFGPDMRKFILHQTDLAQPYIWVPSTSVANNSVVNSGDQMTFLWKVNGCLAVDDTFMQWGTDPDPVSDFNNTTKHNNAYKGKYWGGSGWEGADNGGHAGYTWSETITAPNETGDYYFIIRAMVDQVFGNTTDSALYGTKPFLSIVRERTDPTYSQTIIGPDGPEKINGQVWWWSKVIHVTVVRRPEVLSFSPKDKATWVPTDTNISISFDLPMDHAPTEAALILTPTAAGAFSWSGNTMTFDPDGELASETTYKVGLNRSAKAVMGTTMQSDLNFSFKTAFSPDIVVPKILGTYPPDKAQDVSIRTKIYVNFSEPMNATATQGAFGMVPVTAGTFSWENNSCTLVYTPNKWLNGPIDYSFSIGTSAMDLGKNHLPKLQSFKFRTEVPDKVSPTVIGTYPLDKAVMVPLGTNITMNFSEPMLVANTQKAFSITPYINGTFSWNSTKGSLTFDPEKALTPQTNYTVKVNTSACDLFLNSLVMPYSFKFTSEDITPPSIVQTFPPDKSRDVPVGAEITIDFTEPMLVTPTLGSISIDPKVQGPVEVNGAHVIISPLTDLAYSTTYNVTITTGATDLNGLHMVVPYKFSFTTRTPPDSTPPKVLSTSPTDGATNASLYGDIIVTFSEPIMLRNIEPPVKISPAPLTSFIFYLESNVLRVHTNQPGTKWLAENTPYTVLVSGTVSDTSMNSMGKDYAFAFTTGYAGAPKVDKVTPTDNDVDVPTGTTITIEFSRSMDWTATKGAVFISPPTAGTFSQNGNNLVFTPTKKLKGGVTYSIKVTRAAKDDKGNSLATDFRSVFTTKAVPKQTVLGGGLVLPLLLLLIVIIIVIVVIAVVLRSRKKAKPQGNWNSNATAVAPEPELVQPAATPPPATNWTPPGPVEEPAAPKPQPEPPTAHVVEPAPQPSGSELDDIINQLSDEPK